MKRAPIIAVALASFGIAGFAWGASSDDLTSADTGRAGFNQPFAFVRDEALSVFRSGSAIFRQPWFATESGENSRFGGLGPLSNRFSCIGCHIGNGRGETSENVDDVMRSTLVRLSVPGRDTTGAPMPEPTYGEQLQPTGIYGVLGEGEASITWNEIEHRLPDGSAISLRRPELVLSHLHYGPVAAGTMISVRMTPPVFGLGLLESVPESDLDKLADPDDGNRDGIRGRINHVWNVETGRAEIGRFGLKANQPTLRQQVAGALHGDMGITSRVFPQQNCTSAELDCLKAPSSRSPEVLDDDLATLVSYMRMIAPPARRNADAAAARGETLFKEIGCASCHAPALVTGTNSNLPQISNREIYPYTDMLLHDMGEGLADDRQDFEASGRDWRTTPLWGIGLAVTVLDRPTYLHDGRARSLTEAILWHGGEAKPARDVFASRPKADRDAIISFLGSL